MSRGAPSYRISVTEALAAAGCVDYAWATEAGKWRGSEVHRAVDLFDCDRLRDTPAPIAGYLSAWKRFKREHRVVILESELSVQSIELDVTGRLDKIALVERERSVIDVKLGEIQPAVRLQLALYAHLHEPDRWLQRLAVQLKPDGTYRMNHWPTLVFPIDLVDAKAAVRVARWRIKNGLATRKGI